MWYKLDENKNPVPCDMMDAGRLLEDAKHRRVAATDIEDGVHVSTVFLGLKHHNGLFETMVFGGPLDKEQERYWTWKEAEEGHTAMVHRCKDVMAAEVGGES